MLFLSAFLHLPLPYSDWFPHLFCWKVNFTYILWHPCESLTMSSSQLCLSLESPTELLKHASVQPPSQGLSFSWLGRWGREGGGLYGLGPALFYRFMSPECTSPRRTYPTLISETLHMSSWKAVLFLVFALSISCSFCSIPVRLTSFWRPSLVTHP